MTSFSELDLGDSLTVSEEMRATVHGKVLETFKSVYLSSNREKTIPNQGSIRRVLPRGTFTF